jgi:1-acyl-sn-glycerol-3-phosphate acyltransferase
MMWLYRLNHALGPLIGLYWRLGLEGAVESIPRRGPLLLLSNHASFLDPWLIGMAFPRYIRYLITNRWYERSPLWKGVFRAFGTEPMQTGNPRATIEAVCRVLSRGEVTGIFPEGRISDDGRIQPFRAGATRIAALSGAPVLPLGIRGNYRSLPRHRRFPRPVRVRVHVGEPMVFPGSPTNGPPPRTESVAFQVELLREICRLAGQEDRIPELLASPRLRRAGKRLARDEAPAPQHL